MAAIEKVTVSDFAQVELTTVVPDAPPPEPTPPATPPDATPVEQARDATVEQTGADPPPGCALRCDDLSLRLTSLRLNFQHLAKRVRAVEEYVDTVSSPLHKRVWWWLCGYRFRSVGRWYPPEWRG